MLVLLCRQGWFRLVFHGVLLEPEFIQGGGSLLQGGIELRTGGSLGLACVVMIR